MNDLTIARMKISDNCFRVDNKILITNPDQKDSMILVENMKPNYKVHIMLTYWTRHDPDITYGITAILDAAKEKRAKVYIHIPKKCKDLIRIINRDLEEYNNDYNIIIEGGNTTRIGINAATFHGIPIQFERKLMFNVKPITQLGVRIELILETNVEGYAGTVEYEIHRVHIPRFDYDHDGVFSSVYRKEEPELFREDIIRDFKKATPKSILKSFKNDDDIWDFVMTQNEWEATVKMKRDDGTEYAGSFEDQMKDLAKDIMEETTDENRND